MLAFRRAWERGNGIETDIRADGNHIVIAHDAFGDFREAITLKEFLGEYQQKGNKSPLALNVKCDGMALRLREDLTGVDGEIYFFDMSIPETLRYQKSNLPFLSRLSEYESEVPFLETSVGIWLDQFVSDWVGAESLDRFSGSMKYMAVVSSELHGRNHLAGWGKVLDLSRHFEVRLCTDLPDEAKEFFNEN